MPVSFSTGVEAAPARERTEALVRVMVVPSSVIEELVKTFPEESNLTIVLAVPEAPPPDATHEPDTLI